MPPGEGPIPRGAGEAGNAFALTSELQERLRDVARKAIGTSAKRARALLLLASGLPTAHVADRLGVNTATIKCWRENFEIDGMASLQDGRRRKSPAAKAPEAAGG